MATNPMQRKSRNSFLLGVVLTLVIASAIIALLYMQLKKANDQIKQENASKKSVYVLSEDVESGQILTADMFKQVKVSGTGVPADYSAGDIEEWLKDCALCDKNGNAINKKQDGTLYMKINDEEITVYKEKNDKTDSTKEMSTDRYYTQEGNNKTYIEVSEKTLVSKVKMKANTVITSSLIARINEIKTPDIRTQEYNSIVLPTDLQDGQYVDIRLMLPTGQDYIVVSKKAVSIPDIDGEYLTDTILMNLSEDEILSMSCAIVEAYTMNGSKLYATKYAEAGIQEASSPTYLVSERVAKLMDADPNIVSKAKTILSQRYNDGNLKDMRNNYIEQTIQDYGTPDNVEGKMEESIQLTQQNRKDYLDSLGMSE